jgi:hypothetical protein
MLYFEQNIYILGRKLIDKAEFLEIIKLSYNTITFCKIELIEKRSGNNKKHLHFVK